MKNKEDFLKILREIHNNEKKLPRKDLRDLINKKRAEMEKENKSDQD